MRNHKRYVVLGVTATAALINLILGGLLQAPLFIGAGVCALSYVAIRTGFVRRTKPATAAEEPQRASPPVPAAVRFPPHPDKPENLVLQMLAQHRYALLLRPQIARDLEDHAFAEVLRTLEQAMALVPDGEVVLGRIDDALDDGRLDEEEIAAARGRVVSVNRFFLDRYPVTNRQFFEFVAAGGYEQPALWEESVLPAVLDFVDRTGHPGPRFWRSGCYDAGKEDHPVIGVCWHEAVAYARWVGKRLPTDAEWVKAASWPVPISSTARLQRKYPWGDTMDRRRANLWNSGPGQTVAVGEYAGGVSVGGVHQLIGNVWEWTGGNLRLTDQRGQAVVTEVPMKSLRGGAFDTYFDSQATCQFQSGESMLARKHNIGFRCAVGICDVMLARPDQQPANVEQFQDVPVDEVPA